MTPVSCLGMAKSQAEQLFSIFEAFWATLSLWLEQQPQAFWIPWLHLTMCVVWAADPTGELWRLLRWGHSSATWWKRRCTDRRKLMLSTLKSKFFIYTLSRWLCCPGRSHLCLPLQHFEVFWTNAVSGLVLLLLLTEPKHTDYFKSSQNSVTPFGNWRAAVGKFCAVAQGKRRDLSWGSDSKQQQPRRKLPALAKLVPHPKATSLTFSHRGHPADPHPGTPSHPVGQFSRFSWFSFFRAALNLFPGFSDFQA